MASDKQQQSMTAKIVGGLVALGTAWAAQKIIDTSWRSVTGHTPPAAEDEGDSRWSEILVATAVSGAVIAIARALAARGTAKLIS